MRPLLVHMENFCSYRAPTSVDLHDVDYFVLAGPTGSGKSTVIDAICFALYGSVPRWGKENVIRLALAPSAASGKVALVFESAGRRYGVVRSLVRNSRGTVGTRESRLEELDPAADPASGIEELLAAPVRPIADGDRVTAATERITGLEYRFFTQCVVLPQGRFAEFLQARPSDRQDLLVQLLDARTFEAIKQRAGIESGTAENLAAAAEAQLADLTDADEAAESEAASTLDRLRSLDDRVRSALDDLRRTDEEVVACETDAAEGGRALAALEALAMPEDVPTLAEDLRAASATAERLRTEAARHEEAEAAARERLAALGDKSALTAAITAHQERARLTGAIGTTRAEAENARRAVAEADERVAAAQSDVERAEEERQRVRDAHTAVDLAQRLSTGESCPVCLQTVTVLPEHRVPAALATADRDVRARAEELKDAQVEHRALDREMTRCAADLDALRTQLEVQTGHIRAHPDAEAAGRALDAVREAEEEAEQARRDLRAARGELAEADRRHAELNERTGRAQAALDRARDTVVALGAPPVERADPHAAWTALLGWGEREARVRHQVIETVRARLDELRSQRDRGRDSLAAELTAHEIPVPAPMAPDAVREAVLGARDRAERRLDRIRENRRRAKELAETAGRRREEARVARELARHLRANNFENWLCTEALELLVTTASETLRELSDGQYELVLDGKNAIEVVDYAEAGLRRSVRTLSGGETFQASLALALALSDQVGRFGGGAARSLDSIFLDEGFGTLDPVTLDIVATTLERLTAGGDRMVGIVTHVPALAERVPVRFDVSRDNTGSHLEKKAT